MAYNYEFEWDHLWGAITGKYEIVWDGDPFMWIMLLIACLPIIMGIVFTIAIWFGILEEKGDIVFSLGVPLSIIIHMVFISRLLRLFGISEAFNGTINFILWIIVVRYLWKWREYLCDNNMSFMDTFRPFWHVKGGDGMDYRQFAKLSKSERLHRQRTENWD